MAPSRPGPGLQSLPPILRIKSQIPIPAYSKGAKGLSVLLRVRGILTATTISLGISPRQRATRYLIRAGRNLPDKEFRYLRTVIVTADIHGGLGPELLHTRVSPFRIGHKSLPIRPLACLQRAVFLLNSRLHLFTETH